MILIKDILKKLSLAEILTILFFMSVGVSLIYKNGFFRTLGIEWYLVSLSPQQIFLSSIVLIVSSFGGALIGYWVGVSLKKRTVELSFWVLAFYIVSYPFIIRFFGIDERVPSEINLMIITILIVMFVVNETKFKDSVVIYNRINNKSNIEKVYEYFLPLFLIFSFTAMPYAMGVDAANLILNEKIKLNKVVLKDKTDNWLLIEINGDKVLLKKDTAKPIFKFIEYKDIDEIVVENLN